MGMIIFVCYGQVNFVVIIEEDYDCLFDCGY